MQISGDYGTELLLRYTEERQALDLERRRISYERSAEAQADEHRPGARIRVRLAALLGAHADRMPARGPVGTVGGSQVHAAHR